MVTPFRFAASLIILLVVGLTAATTQQPLHSLLGDPVRIEQTIDRAGYRGLYSKTRGQSLWIEYRATPQSVTGPIPRPQTFRTDLLLPQPWRIRPDDYTNSGYDRGHLKPADDSEDTQENADASMLMSNMTPQLPDLNRVAWRRLESYVREIVKRSDEAIIVTGPMFQTEHCDIAGEIVVPGGTFKVVAVRSGETWKVYAFTALQGFRDQPIEQLRVPLRTVEQLSGFEFFPKLELSRAQKLAVE